MKLKKLNASYVIIAAILNSHIVTPRETLIKTKSPRSNEGTHAADFVTLRFNQRIPCFTIRH